MPSPTLLFHVNRGPTRTLQIPQGRPDSPSEFAVARQLLPRTGPFDARTVTAIHPISRDRTADSQRGAVDWTASTDGGNVSHHTPVGLVTYQASPMLREMGALKLRRGMAASESRATTFFNSYLRVFSVRSSLVS